MSEAGTEVGAPGGSSALSGGASQGSTPSSTTSSSPTTPSQGGDSGGGVDTSFDFIFGESIPSKGDSSAQADLSAAPPQASSTEAPPATAPAQPPAAQPGEGQPQQAAASPPGTTQPASQVPASSSPQLNPADPIGIAQALQEHSAEAIETLANSVFKLNDADLEALDTDITKAIPRLLAKAVVFAQQQFLTQLGNVVPAMLMNHSKVVDQHQKNADKFYSAWPTLDRAKHGELVTELGVRYRKMFPDHTLEQMVQNLGPLVLSAAGLPLTTAVSGAKPAAAPVVAPPPQKPNGFVPASPGTVVQTSLVPENPFGYMEQRE